MKKILLILLLTAFLTGCGIQVGQNNQLPGNKKPVACTQEAKLCPDGSYVGRTGEKCEFAECPVASSSSTQESNTVKFSDSELLHAEYNYVWEWPPDIKITTNTFFCPEISERSIKQSTKTINGHLYCNKEESDGAAGHTFVNYWYSTVKENKLIGVSFVIRYTDCGNYGEPVMQEKCEKEQQSYDPDGLADKVVERVIL